MAGVKIKVQHVFFSYEQENVFNDSNVTFKAGKKTAIMAPSGSGKTTLLYLIAGLLKPDSGIIEFSKKKTDISMVFQENRLLEQQTILCNIQLVNPAVTVYMVKEMLDLAKVPYGPDCMTGKLSGGEKRRVAIIRALLADYDVLLMDEPFTGLDEETKSVMKELIATKTEGKTVLLVTHSEEDAEFCDCIEWI